jgi:hypothetical protein
MENFAVKPASTIGSELKIKFSRNRFCQPVSFHVCFDSQQPVIVHSLLEYKVNCSKSYMKKYVQCIFTQLLLVSVA